MPAYPKDLKQRAKVNEVMDWFNTNFYQDFGYGLVYPQIFPHHKRPTTRCRPARSRGARSKSQGLAAGAERPLARPGSKQYLCGNQITIADYFGSAIMTHRRVDPLRSRRLSQCSALDRQREEAAELGRRSTRRFNGFADSIKGQHLADGLTTEERSMIKGLHHNAYRCRDSEETRRFYEDFLGLPLVNAFEIKETKTGRKTGTGVCTRFYELDDGSCLAFFEAPDMPFEFKEQHDFDLHIALEVTPEALDSDVRQGQGRRAARSAASPTTVHRLDLLPRPQRLRDRAHRQGARPRKRRWTRRPTGHATS